MVHGPLITTLLPVAAASAAAIIGALGPGAGWLAGLAASILGLLCSSALLASPPGLLAGGEFMVDGYAGWAMLTISVVYLLSVLPLRHSIGVMREYGRLGGRDERLAYLLLNGAYAFMYLLAVSNNLFMIWVFLEIATVLTVYLVGLDRRSVEAHEAAWKYFIMCSVGMSFSLYGFVVIYGYAYQAGAGQPWLLTSIARVAAPAPLLTAACGFIVAGFSVKAGLFPVYMWLPDAYAEAPTPVAALLSGALTYLPLYVLLRILHFLGAAAGRAVWLLAVLGLASMLCGAAGMYRTQDAKRLYAYSSIEHMGILAFLAAASLGLGSPGVALAAFNLHAIGHAVSKAAAFDAAGFLDERYSVRLIDSLDPSLDRVAGWGLLAFTVSLAGIPPFPLFISELLGAVSVASNTWLLAAYIVCVFTAFTALAVRIGDLYAEKEGDDTRPLRVPGASMARAAIIAAVAALIILTLLYLSTPALNTLLEAAPGAWP